jgi:transposase
VRMDCHGLEVWLGLPACRVIHQGLGPQQRALPLARRDTPSVCPQGGTGCARVQERRPRGIRALPLLERPVMVWRPLRRFACPDGRHRPWETRPTCGEQGTWPERLSTRVREEGLRGCPGRARAPRDGLSARTVLRWTCARSRGGRPRQLGRALGLDADARRTGPRDHPWRVDVDTGPPMATLQGRRADEVLAWCKSRPQDDRARVEVGV